jgi:hypothetical protein
MFQNTSLLYVFGPAIIVCVIFMLIAYWKLDKQNLSKLDKGLSHFKISLIGASILLVVLWLCIPTTAALSTFGYPKDVSAINDDAKLLYLLQKQNIALVRTIEVLHWFLFLFIGWFLTNLITLLSAVKAEREKRMGD